MALCCGANARKWWCLFLTAASEPDFCSVYPAHTLARSVDNDDDDDGCLTFSFVILVCDLFFFSQGKQKPVWCSIKLQ